MSSFNPVFRDQSAPPLIPLSTPQKPVTPINGDPSNAVRGATLLSARGNEKLLQAQRESREKSQMKKHPTQEFCRTLFDNARVCHMNHIQVFFLYFSQKMKILFKNPEFKKFCPVQDITNQKTELHYFINGKEEFNLSITVEIMVNVEEIFYSFFHKNNSFKEEKKLFIASHTHWKTINEALPKSRLSPPLQLLLDEVNTCFTHLFLLVNNPEHVLPLLKETLAATDIDSGRILTTQTLKENYYCAQTLLFYKEYVNLARQHIDFYFSNLQQFQQIVKHVFETCSEVPQDRKKFIAFKQNILRITDELNFVSMLKKEKEGLLAYIGDFERLCPNVIHANALVLESVKALTTLLPAFEKYAQKRKESNQAMFSAIEASLKQLLAIQADLLKEEHPFYKKLHETLTLQIGVLTVNFLRLETLLKKIDELSPLFFAPHRFFKLFIDHHSNLFKEMETWYSHQLTREFRPIDLIQHTLAPIIAQLPVADLSGSLVDISRLYENFDRSEKQHSKLDSAVIGALSLIKKAQEEVVFNESKYSSFFKQIFCFLGFRHLSVPVLCGEMPAKKKVSPSNHTLLVDHLQILRNALLSISHSLEKSTSHQRELLSLCGKLPDPRIPEILDVCQDQFKKFKKLEKELCSYFLVVIPEKISVEECTPLFSKVTEWAHFLKKRLILAQNDLRKTYAILKTLAIGAPQEAEIKSRCRGINFFHLSLPTVFHQYGVPFTIFHETNTPQKQLKQAIHSFQSKTISKQNLEEQKEDSSSLPLEEVKLAGLLHHLRQIAPAPLSQEDSIQYQLRSLQIHSGLANIAYYAALLDELSRFTGAISFPHSYVYLLTHLCSLTVEQAGKIKIAFDPRSVEGSASLHILFQEGSSLRATHNLSLLLNSFSLQADDTRLISEIAQATVSTRYPASHSGPVVNDLLTLSQDVSILQKIENRGEHALVLAFNLLAQLTPSLTLLPIERRYAHQAPLLRTDAHEAVLLIQKKLEHFQESTPLNNLRHALDCSNELLQLENPLPLAESYALALSTFPLLVLEMATHLQRPVLGEKFGENHDLSEFPADLISPQEVEIFKQTQNRLKIETRYPRYAHGTVAERLATIHALCKMKQALELNWMTEDLIYKIKMRYHQEPMECLHLIQKDLEEQLVKVNEEAVLILSLAFKVLELI